MNLPRSASPASKAGSLRFALLATVLVALALAACVTSPTGRSQLMIVSPETAIAASQRAYLNAVRDLQRENRLLYDWRIKERVESVAGRVVAQAVALYPRTSRWQWSVALIDDDDPNAWCMAGGRMAVNSGLLTELGLSNDELAHIIGHEIAHAIANHTAERMSMVLLTQAGLIAAAIAADEDDEDVLSAASVAADLAIMLPNSRVAESEADRLGMELAIRAGYEPAAAVSMWDKMAAAGFGAGVPQFLSTHPAPGNRQAALRALIPSLGGLPSAASGETYPVAVVP